MSTRVNHPDLRKYMDKKLSIHLNANRQISGVLRGFDPFMNLVLDETVEERSPSTTIPLGLAMIRGNSIVSIEVQDRIL